MTGASCFFIGYHDCPDDYFNPLMATIDTQIAVNNITEFFVGNHGNFDRLATQAVQLIKQHDRRIHLYLVLPSPRRFFILPEGFDNAYCPPRAKSSRSAIISANRHMVDTVNYVITCANGRGTNTDKLLRYAHPRIIAGDLHVKNIMRLAARFDNQLTEPSGDDMIDLS